MPMFLLAVLGAALLPQARQPLRSELVAVPGVVVRAGPHVALEYLAGRDQPKPYVARLSTPSGLNVLRDNVADHLHHHGLMFAFAVEGTNFWEETPGTGQQRGLSLERLPAGVRQTIEWVEPTSGKVLLAEQRRVEVLPSPDPRARLVGWRSLLSAPRGARSVKIAGAHYHGLGMRFVAAMDGGSFENSAGDPGTVFRGEERLMGGRWCAYRANPEGREVTVAAFDHPANVRSATWFTMSRPFGYLSATLRAHAKPLTVEAPVLLRYAVAVWDGSPPAEEIQRLYLAWLRMADSRESLDGEGRPRR